MNRSEDVTLEEKITRLRQSISIQHPISKYNTTENKVEIMFNYLARGVRIGYSSFYTYRISYNIYTLIKNNLNSALLSPDSFIRLMAEKIQQNKDIEEPKY